MTVKTAVSLDEELLERIDRVAEELRLPRSRLLARAAEEFLAEHENRKLLEQLNQAYSDAPAPEEEELLRGHRRRHRRRVEGSW